ncbi:DUF1918 domain-containing protein [Actinophytocola oryzae]|uniref:Uncharacterized protein DUF1918 n=1 Tax=Actinophytocola oryzae TaxID=502181 RepID=A0A4R7V7I1_9PSEU|nr:DUF1918 domain-containing protein [Actinophytocola oryzae]TDV44095.1 uncharacterized protein DUF1918 [Actinophytocola oryzae]
MHAKPGDWLIVEIAGTDHAARRARILDVGSPDGTPPFTVRWLDTEREGLVFPGDGARVLTQEELTALDARVADRATRLQRLVAHPEATS